MKRAFITTLSAALLIFGANFGHAASGTIEVPGHVADYTAGLAANGIGSSRHNLGALGRVLTTDATSEICIFCHTPHHSNTDTKPLWNRNMPNSGSYVPYGQTIAGTDVGGFAAGSVSLACLSCHDGATAFDDLVNAPGKGSNTGDQHWIFTMPGLTGGFEQLDHFGTRSSPNVWCTACHPSSGSGFAYADTWQSLSIEGDLTNDHPVSIVYSGNLKASLRPESTVINSINLTSDLAAGSNTIYGGSLGQNRWAVAGFISDSATIGDLLRNGKVECSSCHDPHFRNLSWDESDATYDPTLADPSRIPLAWCAAGTEDCSDGMFLRRVGGNTGSGVCRTCHGK